MDDSKFILKQGLDNPIASLRSLIGNSLYYCLRFFWDQYSQDPFEDNWHIKMLAEKLETLGRRVAARSVNDKDLIINVPPGSTKTALISIFFPVWCWINWYWMRFITSSHNTTLSLESAEYSRDVIRSEKFQSIFPELTIKQDKDQKSNFRLIKTFKNVNRRDKVMTGGGRISTSVSGGIIGMHAHIIIMDDLLDPKKYSQAEISAANSHMDKLSSRKTDKRSSTMILVMQRLSVDDPTSYMLEKRTMKSDKGVVTCSAEHISLPGEIIHYKEALKPVVWAKYYVNGLMDAKRLNWVVLKKMEMELGQYGFNAQVGQDPIQVSGSMFKTDMFRYANVMPPKHEIVQIVRYWDKAGTSEKELTTINQETPYTAGVKMAKLRDGRFLVIDVVRGHWSSDERETVMKSTAIVDGVEILIWAEQEPGSGGKESAQATIKNLAGFNIQVERPQGDKVRRADPYSVQVNNSNISLLRGDWNQPFIDEHKVFPFGRIKDQVDAAAAAFNALVRGGDVESVIIRRRKR